MKFTHPPLPDGYIPKRPYWHRQQLECFLKSLPQRRFSLWAEPRVGKSKPMVDKSCFYFERKDHPFHITGVLVIAYPNGLHYSWVRDIFPDEVPDRISWQGLVWRSDKCRQVGFRQSFKELCAFKGLALLAINIEALPSEETRACIGAFLKARGSVHVIFDESSAAANSNALRSRIMTNIGKATQYVKLMTNADGTPIDRNGPLSYFSQVGWQGKDILGYDNEVEFRKRYAEIVTKGRAPFWAKVSSIEKELAAAGVKPEFVREAAIRKAKFGKLIDAGTERLVKRGRDWWTAIAEDENGRPKYRNMDEIWAKLDPISYRATFAECFPDAKQNVYSKRFFQLTAKQRKVYNDLSNKYRIELDGDEFTVDHPLTRLLRRQQITSNYYPDSGGLTIHDDCAGLGCEACGDTGVLETGERLRTIDEEINPRLDALEEELRYGRPFGAWCRFRPDVEAVLGLCARLGIAVGRYDGAASLDQKTDAREGFQSGKYHGIVGNEGSLSRGIPLFRAEVLYGYSNMFSFRMRRQVEDRAKHGSKTTATAIVDIVAEETVDDESIIPALRSGMDVSDWVLKDKRREWI